jgi:demethylmenaquinone methyltransferase/2-methoxy-6-polyprenyl-1,4-benzoquinol methylase
MREPTAPTYYDRRAPEYDDWYEGVGLYAERDRAGFDEDLVAMRDVLARLAPARTLDVACGTGFLTSCLRGNVTGLDQSERMLEVSASRLPGATLVQGDALALPFPDDTFDRVVSGHFYGHLDETQRAVFLREARRVAPELVIADASRERSHTGEEWSERVLNDGSSWQVYKRWFTPDGLLDELGGGAVLHAGPWFVVVRSPQ